MRQDREPGHPGPLAIWISSARVPTLTASFVPVAVGTALAARDGALRVGPALAALAGAIFIQIGTNLVNDLGDHRRGADTANRIGPKRALQMGWLTPSEVRAASVICFGLAIAAGLYLAKTAGWPVVGIGIAS